MNILQAVILGIIQGITEFLPVSSSGHLVLFQKLFGIEEPTMFFDVLLHIGTLIPVFIVFRKEIFSILKKPFQKYSYLIITATLPAVVVALLFGDVIESVFEGGSFLGIGFIITGLLLMYSDKITSRNKQDENITYSDATFIGIAQAVAIFPGISRSGSTISASLFRGLNKEVAARFSFLLSIPAIVGAAVLQIKDLISIPNMSEYINFIPFTFGFFASMLSGYLAIKFMLKLIKERKLKIFSYYVFVLGALVIFDQLITKKFF